MKALILGGARSGKSRLAEQWAGQWQHGSTQHDVVYIATSEPADAELNARVASHQARRPPEWGLIEEPLALAATLQREAQPRRCLLVDCLTLWLTNLLMLEDDARLEAEVNALIECLDMLPGRILLVSNETGLGVVPMGALTRRYVDEAGLLHQALAQRCNTVVLTVAGLPHYLKGAQPDD